MIDRTKSPDIGTSAFRDKDEPMYNCHDRLATHPKPAFQFASMSQDGPQSGRVRRVAGVTHG